MCDLRYNSVGANREFQGELGSTSRGTGAELLLLVLVRVHGRCQESISQAVKEGGLVSIRDNEAEVECRQTPKNLSIFLSVSPRVSCQFLSVRSPCACALCRVVSVLISVTTDDWTCVLWLKVQDTEKEVSQVMICPSLHSCTSVVRAARCNVIV